MWPTGEEPGSAADRRRRNRRALASFAALWLLTMTYGCVSMFATHRSTLSAWEGAGLAPGLVDSESQVLRAEHVAHGDTAQSYALVTTTQEALDAYGERVGLERREFDAHTDAERGWSVPDWWPKAPCRGGATYDQPIFDKKPDAPYVNFTIAWCPAERRAYVQRFDY
ncbi:MAG TPA: hypothetical protein VF718_02580 [Allosphingosinicella sp.]